MKLRPPIPVLRIFDESKADQFYLDYLGFVREWEHRFEPHYPIYTRISRGDCVLQLTGHHGDCCPGAKVFIDIDDIERFHRELAAKPFSGCNPGIERAPWNARTMLLTDPFGNRLLFSESDELRRPLEP